MNHLNESQNSGTTTRQAPALDKSIHDRSSILAVAGGTTLISNPIGEHYLEALNLIQQT